MNNPNMISDEDFRAWADEIIEQSPYKRKKTGKKKYMTVHEMGDLLGIKKTERYYLVHKKYFRTDETPFGMRVDIESFEKWYANQDKYHKITGEEPGRELRERSYSVRDISKLLGIEEWQVYAEIKQANVPFITVNYTKRFLVEDFEAWYQGQTKYIKVEDKDVKLEEETMRMPEMARLLGVPRSVVYFILKSHPEIETVMLGDRRRVFKKSFFEWYKKQDKYHLAGDHLPSAIAEEHNPNLEIMRRDTFHMDGSAKNIGNSKNLTLREAAMLAGVDTATISRWGASGKIQFIKAGKMIRIPRAAFEETILKNKEEAENGINC